MGERAFASIDIGGSMPKSLLKMFMSMIKDSGAGPEDSGVEFLFQGEHTNWSNRKRIEFLVQHHNGAFLHLADGEAVGAMFEELETWLKNNNIPFDRHSDAHWEWGASNYYFRPGGTDVVMTSDYNGNDVVEAHLVRSAREALSDGNAHAALKFLDDALGDAAAIPELPPFKVIDG